MIRLFKVYYPLRALVLLGGEATIAWLSFVLGIWATAWLSEVGVLEPTPLQNRDALLNLKILGVTGVVLLFSHWFDRYDSSSPGAKWDQVIRLLSALGSVSLALAAVGFVYRVLSGRSASILPGNWSALSGFIILTFTLLGWRAAYSWMVKQPFLRERVYVLGTGQRAEQLVRGLRERSELGVEVVGWTGDAEGELTRDPAASRSGAGERAERPVRGLLERSRSRVEFAGWSEKVQGELTSDTVTSHLGVEERAARPVRPFLERSGPGFEAGDWSGSVQRELTRETVASHLMGIVCGRGVHRVIVAMPDRRGTLPVEELLDLRLSGVKVEEATSWLERIEGRVEVEQLYPSWLIFAEGFRFSTFFRVVRRTLNFSVALTGLVISLPLLPFVALAVKFGSPGPVFYRQERVGRRGAIFICYKFRTMRQDAEADTGATWAADDDPRITRVGRFLRISRLDEIPQMWCVLKGDMHFVGPRPERPEFVEWLSREIPYYGVRHMVRPGITGWAQVRHKYGNTLEDAREKLQYDLFYIKNASLGLDLLIMFQTIKIVLLGRGAQ